MPKTEGGRPVSITVLDPEGGKVELQRNQVAKMEQHFERFWNRFNGSVGLGAIYNKGNQSTQYNLSRDVDCPRDRWAASLSYNSALSSSTGTPNSSRNQIDASAYHLLPWNNWYYTGIAGFLQSTEQGIQLQSSFGGGMGRYLKNSNGPRSPSPAPVASPFSASTINKNYWQLRPTIPPRAG